MTNEINSLPTSPPAASVARPALTGAEVVKLTQPIDSLLAIGDSANAQVISLKQAGQDFQLLLRLTLAGGSQATVQAGSSQPLAQGTALLVTNLPGNNLAISVQQGKSASVANLTQLDTQKLPVGTLLQGKVVTSQLLAQGPGQPAVYRSMVSLLNTALAGTTLTIDSPQPLRLNSLLSAQVQGSQALSLVPLSGRLDQLEIAQQLATQQGRQASLQGLLSSLQGMLGNRELPADARASAEKLLASLPDIRQMVDPKTVAQALSNSGVFLEASLLNGQAVPDTKAALLRLVAQLNPAVPGAAPFTPGAAATVLAQALPGYVRSALGMLGQVGAKPPPAGFPLPAKLLQGAEGEDDLEHLLRLAGAAIARLQSHQLSSLEQTGRSADGNLQTTWQLEIPMRNLQDIVPLQVKVQREDPPDDDQPAAQPEQRSPKERLWRVELAFDLAPLGPLQVQAQLSQGSLSSQLWAEHPGTAALIESQLGALRERLVASGLDVAELHCHQGTPPQGPRTHLEQRWVDETA